MKLSVDLLYILFASEVLLVALIAAVVLMLRSRRYRKLYEQAKARLEGSDQEEPAEDRTEAEPVIERPPTVAPIYETPGEPEPELEPEPEPAPSGLQTFDLDEDRIGFAEETPPAEDDTSLSGKVSKLNRVVNYQKNKILDLMCYKDLFDSAQRKLTNIQQSNEELQGKIKVINETADPQDELAWSISAFEGNNQELASFIKILEKENEGLSEKFRTWEEDLKELYDGEETVDEGRYSEVIKEKEAMVEKLREFEEKLQEKSGMLGEMQKQYEDLETEYMILYRQQQQQQQQPQ